MKCIVTKINDILYYDIKNIIWGYIPVVVKVSLSKTLYLKYYKTKNALIPPIHFRNYIRYIIRKDCSFVIKMNLNLYFDKWLKKKNIYYKDYKINNYINFLLHLCFENHSTKCEREIKEYIKKCGLDKTWYKRIILKNNKWKT